jgi:hypothetical protein
VTTKRAKGKEKKGAAKEPRKPFRLTQRLVVGAWMALVLVLTGAWYLLSATPDAQEIERLESGVRRAETNLTNNRERVATLEARIASLTAQLNDFHQQSRAYDRFFIDTQPTATQAERLIAILTRAGLSVIDSEVPSEWTSAAPKHWIATYRIDVTGTYSQVTAGLQALETTEPGLGVRELIIAKAGGNPNDPTLQARFTIRAHARDAHATP